MAGWRPQTVNMEMTTSSFIFTTFPFRSFHFVRFEIFIQYLIRNLKIWKCSCQINSEVKQAFDCSGEINSKDHELMSGGTNVLDSAHFEPLRNYRHFRYISNDISKCPNQLCFHIKLYHRLQNGVLSCNGPRSTVHFDAEIDGLKDF